MKSKDIEAQDIDAFKKRLEEMKDAEKLDLKSVEIIAKLLDVDLDIEEYEGDVDAALEALVDELDDVDRKDGLHFTGDSDADLYDGDKLLIGAFRGFLKGDASEALLILTNLDDSGDTENLREASVKAVAEMQADALKGLEGRWVASEYLPLGDNAHGYEYILKGDKLFKRHMVEETYIYEKLNNKGDTWLRTEAVL